MLVGYGQCTKCIRCELRNTQQIWLLSVTERTESAHCVLPNISKACLLCVTKPENLRVLSFTERTKNVFWGYGIYRERLLWVCVLRNTPNFWFLRVTERTNIAHCVWYGTHNFCFLRAKESTENAFCVCVCFTNALGFTERTKNIWVALRNAQWASIVWITEHTGLMVIARYGTHRWRALETLKSVFPITERIQGIFCVLRNTDKLMHYALRNAQLVCARVHARACMCTVRIASL